MYHISKYKYIGYIFYDIKNMIHAGMEFFFYYCSVICSIIEIIVFVHILSYIIFFRFSGCILNMHMVFIYLFVFQFSY